ncbi:MAG TPA: hypothetical protein VN420_04635 [Candidatus Fimivivens sp.]|nr:hypothetical protein [Candidatus Fimivivens sp.]
MLSIAMQAGYHSGVPNGRDALRKETSVMREKVANLREALRLGAVESDG